MSVEATATDVASVLAVARSYRLRRSGDITDDLTLFTALLREVGVPVSVGAGLLAVRAMSSISLDRPVDVRAALCSCLTAGADEAAIFGLAFGVFWSAEVPALAESATQCPSDPSTSDEDTGSGGRLSGPRGGGEQGAGERQARRARYSASGSHDRDVVALQNRSREIDALARRLARALARSKSRRHKSADTGELVDVRDSMRRNLRFGEELLELRRSRQPAERARLVALCDVSSSMEPYTPLFLTFLHALMRIAGSVEGAIFNVELCVVTDIFHRRSLSEALRWLADRSIALAGGTKTGHCLFAFNNQIQARGLVGRATTALVLSDGWDVGEPELLEDQMRRLRSQVGRVLWLDPHAAAADYQPQVRGLVLALPFVDAYLDFSDLPSLARLVTRMEAQAA